VRNHHAGEGRSLAKSSRDPKREKRRRKVPNPTSQGRDPPKASRQARLNSSSVIGIPDSIYFQVKDAPLMAIKENLPPKPVEVVPPRKRIRRKLMDSPQPSQTVGLTQFTERNDAEDSISEELTPIVYTPEMLNKTVTITKEVADVPSIDQNLESTRGFMAHDQDFRKLGFTFNLKTGSQQADLNSTVILSQDSVSLGPESNVKEAKPPTSMLQRLGLPSLLNKNLGKLSDKPSYMAMTSAAERKRKLLSHGSDAGVLCSALLRAEYSTAVRRRRKGQRPSACALQYFACPQQGRAKYACAGAVAEDQKRTSCNEDGRRRSGPETPIFHHPT
ncbi:unnamed protein product, partial [Ranitomeya imitator]